MLVQIYEVSSPRERTIDDARLIFSANRLRAWRLSSVSLAARSHCAFFAASAVFSSAAKAVFSNKPKAANPIKLADAKLDVLDMAELHRAGPIDPTHGYPRRFPFRRNLPQFSLGQTREKTLHPQKTCRLFVGRHAGLIAYWPLRVCKKLGARRILCC